ncbi:hypothetical protein IMG5_050970 [Ichthyophthirius multifiliis]|uniref:Uncharacterized protein n=1 Tax=Ichthyophthirius multifiliis TaxID=5932 RepID=G0QMP6_ICHMU|nr:hypothetical protein IMG5_050970 [Ichthyophthirius multifiliis]EGR33502.1 hypothetical protein IMG5_050970 [Ichthyophthirius multifiliis]|eukprot:XP_004037488.1 hypothetical protein IMG5_050970 [Ichthyophthirius multifiliis]
MNFFLQNHQFLNMVIFKKQQKLLTNKQALMEINFIQYYKELQVYIQDFLEIFPFQIQYIQNKQTIQLKTIPMAYDFLKNYKVEIALESQLFQKINLDQQLQ